MKIGTPVIGSELSISVKSIFEGQQQRDGFCCFLIFQMEINFRQNHKTELAASCSSTEISYSWRLDYGGRQDRVVLIP